MLQKIFIVQRAQCFTTHHDLNINLGVLEAIKSGMQSNAILKRMTTKGMKILLSMTLTQHYSRELFKTTSGCFDVLFIASHRQRKFMNHFNQPLFFNE